jgi:hypothetical protein
MNATRLFLWGLVLFSTAATAVGAPGDQWILPIADLQGGGWIAHPGAGYGGQSAWEGSGMDGIRRVYWKTDDTTMPTTTELYTIDYFVPLDGPSSWQPIESQISGSAGETYPNDPKIPWVGVYGTNHEYIGAYDPGEAGSWHATGPGPHTPESADYGAGANGIYMWLHRGSWLYAKWDFGWPIDNTVSAIRLTQITGQVPEPGMLVLVGLGAASLALCGRRRRKEVR